MKTSILLEVAYLQEHFTYKHESTSWLFDMISKECVMKLNVYVLSAFMSLFFYMFDEIEMK